MKVGVVTFPGSLDDVDARRAVTIGGNEAVALWHGDDDLRGVVAWAVRACARASAVAPGCGACAQAERLMAPSRARVMRFIEKVLSGDGVDRGRHWTPRAARGSLRLWHAAARRPVPRVALPGQTPARTGLAAARSASGRGRRRDGWRVVGDGRRARPGGDRIGGEARA